MTIYICRRCNYTTNRKSNLLQHLEGRKKKCVLLTDNSIYQCYTTNMLLENSELSKDEEVKKLKEDEMKQLIDKEKMKNNIECSLKVKSKLRKNSENQLISILPEKKVFLEKNNIITIKNDETSFCGDESEGLENQFINLDNYFIKSDGIFYCKICYKEFTKKFNFYRHLNKCSKKN